MPRIKYSHEQKVQALALVEKMGVTEASAELGITKNTLYRWLNVSKGNVAVDDLTAEAQTLIYEADNDLVSENKRLIAENERLTAENAKLRDKIAKMCDVIKRLIE